MVDIDSITDMQTCEVEVLLVTICSPQMMCGYGSLKNVQLLLEYSSFVGRIVV